MFVHHVTLVIELEDSTWYSTNWTQEIDDSESLLAVRARKVERQPEDIDATL